MELETDLVRMEVLSSDGLAQALATLHPLRNTRAILSQSAEHYIQAGAYANGYVIERRSGNEASHVHARHVNRAPLDADLPIPERPWWQKFLGIDVRQSAHDHAFALAEVVEVFSAYFDGADYPEYIVWHEGCH